MCKYALRDKYNSSSNTKKSSKIVTTKKRNHLIQKIIILSQKEINSKLNQECKLEEQMSQWDQEVGIQIIKIWAKEIQMEIIIMEMHFLLNIVWVKMMRVKLMEML